MNRAGAVLGWLAAAFAVLAGIGAGGRLAWRTLRGLARFLDDWKEVRGWMLGDDEHPSMAAQLVDLRRRMARVEGQFARNGGATLADAVDRLESAVGTVPPPNQGGTL